MMCGRLWSGRDQSQHCDSDGLGRVREHAADPSRERRNSERRDDYGDRHDLDDSREGSDKQPVRKPDEPKRRRQHGRHRDDEDELPSDVRPELQVNQVPRVPDDAPFARALICLMAQDYGSHRIDAIPLAAVLKQSERWRRVYADGKVIVFRQVAVS